MDRSTSDPSTREILHAEMAIIDKVRSMEGEKKSQKDDKKESDKKEPLYIGISKLCCKNCHNAIESFNEVLGSQKVVESLDGMQGEQLTVGQKSIATRGSHYHEYNAWKEPQFFIDIPSVRATWVHKTMFVRCRMTDDPKEKAVPGEILFFKDEDVLKYKYLDYGTKACKQAVVKDLTDALCAKIKGMRAAEDLAPFLNARDMTALDKFAITARVAEKTETFQRRSDLHVGHEDASDSDSDSESAKKMPQCDQFKLKKKSLKKSTDKGKVGQLKPSSTPGISSSSHGLNFDGKR